MYTKLSMIEETLKRKKDAGGGAPLTLPMVASDKESNVSNKLFLIYIYIISNYDYH